MIIWKSVASLGLHHVNTNACRGSQSRVPQPENSLQRMSVKMKVCIHVGRGSHSRVPQLENGFQRMSVKVMVCIDVGKAPEIKIVLLTLHRRLKLERLKES